MDSELTDKEIERIDSLHDITYDAILRMLPEGRAIEYDLDMIVKVIEAVQEEVCKRGVCTEMEFYPYRESGIEGPVEGDDVPGGLEDPSVDCHDFYWANDFADGDYPKCCKMCGNYNKEVGKCPLDRPC